jgi:hypothetical protein
MTSTHREVSALSQPQVRWTVKRMMRAVAILAITLAPLVLAYREACYITCSVEFDYCHRRAEEETYPARKALWADRAAYFDGLMCYYLRGW